MSGVLAVLGGETNSFSLGTAGTLADDDEGLVGSAGITLSFDNDGTAVFLGNNVLGIQSFNWVNPTHMAASIAASGLTIRLDVNSGTAPSVGVTGTDLALSSDRLWNWARSTNGTTTANVSLTLKNGAGNTTLGPVTFDISVTVSGA